MGKIRCDECKLEKNVKHVIKFKGRHLCTTCIFKLQNTRDMMSAQQIMTHHRSFEQSLNKIYEVKGYINKSSNTLSAYIHVPQILVGQKVKLVITK